MKIRTSSAIPNSRDRLVVRTLRCGRNNPGSNPGHGRSRENIATKTQQSFKDTPTDHADLSKTTGQFTIRKSCTLCLKRKVDVQIRPDDCGILIESSSVSKSRDSSPPYQNVSQQVGKHT
ncbi:hypothetical protein T07_11014 [Trichinella nelsoni]|uniref:Uncharacterized protein n=1 Tax=Trichinella nelsoni TaxID=6336 RepID=A0A0V0RQU8_9BILA|nr:hypothetical protein T07_11014 [Trichinella nelsoni]